MTVAEQWGAPDGETMRRRLNKALRSGEWKLVFHDRYVLGGGNENVYYVRPAGSLHRSLAVYGFYSGCVFQGSNGLCLN